MLEKNTPLETIKTEYKRAWDYCQQGKYAEARIIAYALLKTEQAGAKWYADVILSQAEENSIKCLTHLKTLLQTDQPMPWAYQRFKQIKSELLDEAGHALGRYDYPLAENILKLIFEVAPNDPTAMVLRDFLRQSKVPMPEEIVIAQSESHIVASAQETIAEEAAIVATPPATIPVEETKPFSPSDQTQAWAFDNDALTISVESAEPSTATEKEPIPAENKIAEHPKATLQVEKHAHIVPEKTIWQLYPVATRLKLQELAQIVEEYRKAGRWQELAVWLNERIGCHPRYAPHYVELAHIYEEETREIAEAYKVLRNLLTVQLADPSAEKWLKETAWKLLQFCKRNHRVDLAQQLHDAVKKLKLDDKFFQELADFIHSFAPVAAEIIEAQAPATTVLQEMHETNKTTNNLYEEFAKEATTPATENHRDDKSQQRSHKSVRTRKAKRGFGRKGRVGIFIDHENLWKNAQSVSKLHNIPLPETWKGKTRWFSGILRRLLERAEAEFQGVTYRIAVGNWNDSSQAFFLRVYVRHKFLTLQPEWIWARGRKEQNSRYTVRLKENSVDFKLADEIRRVQQQALLTGSPLRQIIIVSGDGDYAHLASNIMAEEARVQIWSVRDTVHPAYYKILGKDNVVFIDEDCLHWQQSLKSLKIPPIRSL